jgi:hypothetical protein
MSELLMAIIKVNMSIKSTIWKKTSWKVMKKNSTGVILNQPHGFIRNIGKKLKESRDPN